MAFVSITRLRIRRLVFMPGFFVHAIRAQRQLQRAPGFLAGALLPDRQRIFWTMTLWDSADSMRTYMTSGSHRAAMPKLLVWCDQASVVHWDLADAQLPSWAEADRRMRQDGRASKVRHAAPGHAAMDFAPPRLDRSVPIAPR